MDAFAAADIEGTGSITVDRYLEYMKVKGDNQTWIDWFQK
jgi:hypothetical protein